MQVDKGGELLKPDYTKLVSEVYRNFVEAALVNFENTDVLLYVHGTEDPSWVPRWENSMLFRNPFRFSKSLPWRPAGDTHPPLNIDKKSKVLSLTGSVIDTINFVDRYKEGFFSNSLTKSGKGQKSLREL